MDKSWGHCAKWNKLDRERQILYDLTYMWNLKNKRTHRKRVDSWLPGGGGTGEGGQIPVLRWKSSVYLWWL